MPKTPNNSENNGYCVKCWETQADIINKIPCPIHDKNNSENWEKEFFDRLAEKLEEIFPKTNQKCPQIPSKGNRRGALLFNSYANIIFRDIIDRAIAAAKKEERGKLEKKYGYDIPGEEIIKIIQGK